MSNVPIQGRARRPRVRKPRRLAVAVLVLAGLGLGAWPGAAVAEDGEDAGFQRPKFNLNQRYKEDWSGLRGQDPSTTGDFFDPIKFVPLNKDGSWYASFGGQARLRFEDWHNFGFGKPNDDAFGLWRARFHADVHLGEIVRVFAEGKSAFLMGGRNLPGGTRTLDADSIDLQQAFFDIRMPIGEDATFTVRGGRQELLFGAQRLVSPLDWSNTRRAWDGVMGIFEFGDWTVTGFWTQVVPVRKYDFNDSDSQTEFYGAYATGKVPTTDIGLDLYYLGLDRNDNVTFNGTTGAEERHTVGGRLFGKIGDSGFDYDVEGAYQFGEVGSSDIDAFMFATQVGYKFKDFYGAPRLWIGFDYSSGDKSAGGDVETFNHLFPLGHKYHGFIDVVGRQNVIDINPGVTIKPFANIDGLNKLSLLVWGHVFFRAEDSDALYNAGGGVVRAGGLSNDEEIGGEIDVVLKYPFDRHTTLEVGYSHFFAGDFIEEATPAADEDIDFFYAQLQYTF